MASSRKAFGHSVLYDAYEHSVLYDAYEHLFTRCFLLCDCHHSPVFYVPVAGCVGMQAVTTESQVQGVGEAGEQRDTEKMVQGKFGEISRRNAAPAKHGG